MHTYRVAFGRQKEKERLGDTYRNMQQSSNRTAECSTLQKQGEKRENDKKNYNTQKYMG